MRRKAVALLLIAVGGALLLKWLTTATPISKSQAVEIFQKNNAAAGPQKIATDPLGSTTTERSQEARHGEGTAGKSEEKPLRPTGSTNSSSRSAPSDATSSGIHTMPLRYVPEEGVYTYRTDGREKMSGHEVREFPTTTYRNIVHTGPRSWTEHHTFLEERQMWTALRFEGTAQVMAWTRQKVVFGIDHGKTLEFDPPMRLWWLPWETGRSWGGAWTDVSDGKTSGTYEAKTGGHSFMKVGHESIEVWLDEISVVAHGELEGTVEVRRWTSPQYGIALREEITTVGHKGPLTYSSDWVVQLVSLEPER